MLRVLLLVPGLLLAATAIDGPLAPAETASAQPDPPPVSIPCITFTLDPPGANVTECRDILP